MKLAIHLRRASLRRVSKHLRPAMTLLELTIVILMLLTLIGILAIGARTWKKGTDRSVCIMNLQAVQKGVRSFANLYGYEPGASVAGLEGQVIGAGRFIEQSPRCPSAGVYASGGDVVPALGSLYFNCSLAGTGDHQPVSYEDW